jgi:hypothetical protein
MTRSAACSAARCSQRECRSSVRPTFLLLVGPNATNSFGSSGQLSDPLRADLEATARDQARVGTFRNLSLTNLTEA